MREVLYLPWGKKKSNQRKIEIKFNNLFGKKKTKIFHLKPTKLWWMKTDILTDQKPTAAKNTGLFKKWRKKSKKKTHAEVLRMIAIKFNNRRILLLNWHFFKKANIIEL